MSAFRRRTDGVSAIEFGLIAMPFTFFLFAIIETGYIFLVAILLEGAAADGAREIRTGQVQLSGTPQTTFETGVCGAIGVLLNCDTKIWYDVYRYDTIGDIDATIALPTDGGTNFNTGNPGDIVVLRLVYDWRFITPFLENFLGTAAGDTRQLVASVVFRNEQYND
jgi:Flp pilus assembly protein TadG